MYNHSTMDTLKKEMDAAYQDMAKAKEAWLEAMRGQQEAFLDLRSHVIRHDDFEEYLKETAYKKDIYSKYRNIYIQKKAIYDRIKTINSEGEIPLAHQTYRI